MVKYIHLRHMGSNGLPMTRGGVTIAYVEDPSGQIRYGISRCNDTDNYDRTYGRAKALGRLHSLAQKHAKNRGVIRSDNHSSPMQRVVFDLVERGIWNGI